MDDFARFYVFDLADRLLVCFRVTYTYICEINRDNVQRIYVISLQKVCDWNLK